jgi:hypothetical protein
MKMLKNYFLLLVLTIIFSLIGCSPDLDLNYSAPIYPTYSYYTIKYDANGGKGTPPRDLFIKEGETIEVAFKGYLYYYGKSFVEWNTNADGSGTVYAEGSSLIVNEDITLYAQWFTLPCIITYYINNGIGTVPEPEEIIIGDDITLPDGSGLSREGYLFNGWNTQANGNGEHYAAGISLTPSASMDFYAIWAAPAINNADSYKTVTSNGTVEITLLKGVQYVHEKMKKYYLYRSEEKNGVYTKISDFTPPSSLSQLTLKDNTVDWNGNSNASYYYYKVAAVLEDDTEMRSIGGIYIYLSPFPTTYMMRSQFSYRTTGYCGLILRQTDSEGYLWEKTPSVSNTRYELEINTVIGRIRAGNYTMVTASTKDNWNSPVDITLKRAHITTIYIYENKAVSEFDKFCWQSF